MDEIEYKLNTNNSVLVVNAVDKLISLIKSEYKPTERQKFVLENEHLKVLRSKCLAKEQVVSLTACQGLLALVELGVLEIGHTMSTIVTLLPGAHNYSAIISTMAGLLILDLKSRLVPGQPYRCQFSLKSPKHPFITVLENNSAAEDDVLAQMQALCTHPDYVVSSNSLELLRPVFTWLTCCPRRSGGARPWQLLLSLPPSEQQLELVLSCLGCQQICNPVLVGAAREALGAVAATAALRRDAATAALRRDAADAHALLPLLARVGGELLKHGRDPRACYSLMERCVSLTEAGHAAALTLALLADHLPHTTPLYLHELLNLCLNIITKFKCSSISLNTFVALSLQWLHMPSYLTTSALRVASKILDIYQNEEPDNQRLDTPNLKANKIFETLLYTDSRLSVLFKLNETWEKIRDDPGRLAGWLGVVEAADASVKLELVGFLLGVAMERRKEEWFEEIALRALRIVVSTVEVKKELSVLLLPVLMYKLANDPAPPMRLECLRALPLMAKTKENVHNIVSIMNKLKAGRGVPTALLIEMYASLAETQVRCFPYLLALLAESPARPDDLKWEVDVARALAVRRICEIRPSTHGLELVSTISSILNRCTDKAGSVATTLVLEALACLWRGAAVAPPSTWRALEPKLGRDNRPAVQISICKLLGEVPGLRVQSPEYDKLAADAARKLWSLAADAHQPSVAIEACRGLAAYRLDDYTLKDVPQVYRNSVKLPASFCKTPADAARRPEDVLDYVPCEIWPEVFKYTNQEALDGVEYLATRLIEREVRAYRSGVYQHDARTPPQSLGYLPPTSVLRGLMDCFKKQITSPSYDFPDAVLLSILRVLGADYPRPLPPVELWFLQELFHRGAQWPRGCLQLAAAQASCSPHARSLLDNYLLGVAPETTKEADIMLMFELLPILCRGMPPNSLRGPLERCLSSSLDECLRTPQGQEPAFVRQLELVRACLESERIHDANRTLLSQIVEGYFAVLPEDNVAWPTYVQTCRALSSTYLERMTSPSGWWEVTGSTLRKACDVRCALAAGTDCERPLAWLSEIIDAHAGHLALQTSRARTYLERMTSPSGWWEVTGSTLRKAYDVRCALAAGTDCERPLAWLSEIIDAHAGHLAEQQYSLQCMLGPLLAARPDEQATREWVLQLMARSQVAFKETEDLTAHLYLCDVFMLSVVVLSGHHATVPAGQLPGKGVLPTLLPAAAAALLARPPWQPHALQVVEWVSHTRGALCMRGPAAATAAACHRTLVALRHTPQFTAHNMWTRLENNFGNVINTAD